VAAAAAAAASQVGTRPLQRSRYIEYQQHTLPKGPTSIKSTSWNSLLPENRTFLTSIDHFKSSAKSSSSCRIQDHILAVIHHPLILLTHEAAQEFSSYHVAPIGAWYMYPAPLSLFIAFVW
jgi:hypothetical protein